jgi:hypothetical protein
MEEVLYNFNPLQVRRFPPKRKYAVLPTNNLPSKFIAKIATALPFVRIPLDAFPSSPAMNSQYSFISESDIVEWPITEWNRLLATGDIEVTFQGVHLHSLSRR